MPFHPQNSINAKNQNQNVMGSQFHLVNPHQPIQHSQNFPQPQTPINEHVIHQDIPMHKENNQFQHPHPQPAQPILTIGHLAHQHVQPQSTHNQISFSNQPPSQVNFTTQSNQGGNNSHNPHMGHNPQVSIHGHNAQVHPSTQIGNNQPNSHNSHGGNQIVGNSVPQVHFGTSTQAEKMLNRKIRIVPVTVHSEPMVTFKAKLPPAHEAMVADIVIRPRVVEQIHV